MKSTAIVLGLAIFSAGCVGDGYIPDDKVGTFKTADGKDVECRRLKELGTRLGKRVCMEPKQWAEVERAEKEAAEDFGREVTESGLNRSTLNDIN